MIIKVENGTAAMYDAWSQRDPDRYHPGECEKKWKTFNRDDARLGTLIDLAISKGWEPAQKSKAVALGWDSEIGPGESRKIVDPNWLSDEELPEPHEPWSPAWEITQYMGIFGTDEYVCVCTKSYETEAGPKPTKGDYSRTAGDIMEAVKKHGDDIGKSLGDYNPEVGAWVRFNPLDGQGVSDRNVTAFRYALIESDSMELGKQYALLKELKLPIRILVFSGGKSLHAIVKVDAPNFEEYRHRVDKLYKVCEDQGLIVDRQNRNPSRLSRLPGVERNGRKQYIVAENIGLPSWEAWDEYITGETDDLPDIECFDDMPDEPLNPELIEGILREQHKMLLSGPSKAGKSFLLMELAVCISEGLPWLGRKCTKGRVLYINLEVDRKSARARIKEIRDKMGVRVSSRNLDIWNLRGAAQPLDKLSKRIVEKTKDRKYKAIIIDPIYKIITGDENSAEEMAKFCNLFDWISTKVGSAMIYCHHHSKGSQGQKKAMDRASGSGVFARDPDAILDMIQLPDKRNAPREMAQRWLAQLLDQNAEKWRVVLGDDADKDVEMIKFADREIGTVTDPVRPWIRKSVSEYYYELLHSAEDGTAWRLEATLREFKPLEPIYFWFTWPIHILDTEHVLNKLHAEGERGAIEAARDEKKNKAKQEEEEKRQAFDTAYQQLEFELEQAPTKKDLMARLDLSQNAIERQMKEYGYKNQNFGGNDWRVIRDEEG